MAVKATAGGWSDSYRSSRLDHKPHSFRWQFQPDKSASSARVALW